MKSITIHGLDSKLSSKISSIAKEKGLSLNKTIKLLLMRTLGLNAGAEEIRTEEFSKFLGVWNESDYKSFEINTRVFEKIDEEDWE